MRKEVYETLGDLMIATGNKIKAGNCVMEEEQALETMALIAHIPVSKETASSGLNMSSSKFDESIRMRKLPKGRKNRGWKELRWYVDELINDKLKLPTLLRRMNLL